GMRLHHRVALVRRRVSLVELYRRDREGPLKVTNAVYRRGAAAFAAVCSEEGRMFGLSRQIEVAGFTRITGTKQVGSRPSLLESLRHNDRNGLVIVLNHRPAEQVGIIHAAPAEPWHIQSGHDRDHAGRDSRLTDINRVNAAFSNR